MNIDDACVYMSRLNYPSRVYMMCIIYIYISAHGASRNERRLNYHMMYTNYVNEMVGRRRKSFNILVILVAYQFYVIYINIKIMAT